MSAAVTQDLIGVLTSLGQKGDVGSAKRSRSTKSLHLEVEGVGRVQMPIVAEQAEQLCRVGSLAHYGLGEDTLLDRAVRDTWKIPEDKIVSDIMRWQPTLDAVVQQLADDLGIPDGSWLRAEC